jgi:hypothetical protein
MLGTSRFVALVINEGGKGLSIPHHAAESAKQKSRVDVGQASTQSRMKITIVDWCNLFLRSGHVAIRIPWIWLIQTAGNFTWRAYTQSCANDIQERWWGISWGKRAFPEIYRNIFGWRTMSRRKGGCISRVLSHMTQMNVLIESKTNASIPY